MLSCSTWSRERRSSPSSSRTSKRPDRASANSAAPPGRETTAVLPEIALSECEKATCQPSRWARDWQMANWSAIEDSACLSLL
ncbi:hypothetical protein D3C78_1566410 [compost metagenome]